MNNTQIRSSVYRCRREGGLSWLWRTHKLLIILLGLCLVVAAAGIGKAF